MSISPLLSAFALLFVAEIGDKTQLAVMTLASRYTAVPVAAGAFTAFLVLNALAVVLGDALSRYLPQSAVMLAAGLLFLVFAYRTALDRQDEEGGDSRNRRNAFWTSFSMVFIAELGDKTQVALVALSASTGEPWTVFIGGTLALWTVSLLGVLAGRFLLSRLPGHWVQYGAALLFLVFGVYFLWDAFRGLQTATV